MRLFTTILLLTFLLGCNQTKTQNQNNKTIVTSDTIKNEDDSLILTVEKHGDTVYKHFIDPDSTKGDNFDDSYHVKSIYKTIPNNVNLTSNLFFIEDDYKVFFNPEEVINYCDKSISMIKKGENLDYNEKSFEALRQFAASCLAGQKNANQFDYDWLPALLINCKFSIINTKTYEKPKAVLVEYYRTEFSGGNNFYLMTQKGDTLNFVHDMDYIN